jgi:polyisoprenoid-binding protein YceI
VCCFIALFVIHVGTLDAQAVASGSVRHGTLAFDAQATLGAFTGTTSTVTGELVGAPTLAGVRGWVEAPAKSLSSQNGKRDRDTWASLEVERFPTLRFQLDSVVPGNAVGDSTSVVLVGHLILHGQSRPVRITGYLSGGSGVHRFRGSVPINVKDYGIQGLSKAFGLLRMKEQIMVRVDVTFSAGAG